MTYKFMRYRSHFGLKNCVSSHFLFCATLLKAVCNGRPEGRAAVREGEVRRSLQPGQFTASGGIQTQLWASFLGAKVLVHQGKTNVSSKFCFL